jgi:hypothetical protein
MFHVWSNSKPDPSGFQPVIQSLYELSYPGPVHKFRDIWELQKYRTPKTWNLLKCDVCVFGYIAVADVSNDVSILYSGPSCLPRLPAPDDECNTIFRNVGNYLPKDAV